MFSTANDACIFSTQTFYTAREPMWSFLCQWGFIPKVNRCDNTQGAWRVAQKEHIHIYSSTKAVNTHEHTIRLHVGRMTWGRIVVNTACVGVIDAHTVTAACWITFQM